MKPIAPCRGCQDRSATCHSTCTKYQEFEAKNRKYLEESKDYREKASVYYTKVGLKAKKKGSFKK